MLITHVLLHLIDPVYIYIYASARYFYIFVTQTFLVGNVKKRKNRRAIRN